jgi:hypothetical protein
MKNHVRRFLDVLVVVGIVWGLTATDSVFADANSRVVRPHKESFPLTYEEWSARWWQYIFGLPLTDHPLNDTTGERCAVGQWGPVFFLVGPPTTGDAVERSCTVPSGKGILFPIVNVACAIPEDGGTLGAITSLCTSIADLIEVDTLSVSIDGDTIKDLDGFRFQSPAFSFTGETPNVFSAIGCGTPPCYEGFRETAISDGYWILLKPLKVGNHEIHFHGEIPDFHFVVDVTYDLTVEP